MPKEEPDFMVPLLPLSPDGVNIGMIRTDPLGSYTGLAAADEEPVQDADDL